jgi:hypothetical protein
MGWWCSVGGQTTGGKLVVFCRGTEHWVGIAPGVGSWISGRTTARIQALIQSYDRKGLGF